MAEEVQEVHHWSFFDECEKGRKEKESKRSEKRTKARQTLEKFGKWLFLLFESGQNWLSVNAAAEGPQISTEAMTRMQQEVQIKDSNWTEVVPKMWNLPKGGQNINPERCKKIGVHFAEWVGMEHREKRHV